MIQKQREPVPPEYMNHPFEWIEPSPSINTEFSMPWKAKISRYY
jgi:hypothetical protein